MSSDKILLAFIGAVWIAWAVVWGVLARSAKPVARRETPLSRMIHLVPSMLAVWLLVDRAPFLPWLNAPAVARGAWLAPAGAVLVVAGLLFAVWARFGLGSNWSGLVTVQQAHALVRDGAYALVRHPIYTGLLLGVTGTALAIDERRCVLAVLLVVGAILRRVRQEEAFMIETFGAEYESYRGETAALVPFIW
jgi:protein-S-isoprenylcysteine O-methyltransferase Ste14